MKQLMRIAFVIVALIFTSVGSTQEPAKKRSLFAIDAQGKEVEIQNWKFLTGTKPFSVEVIKAPPPIEIGGKKIDIAKLIQAPEVFEFREEHSTTFLEGIKTLIPLKRIKKIDFDNEKKAIAVTVHGPGDKDEVLTGTTRFANINKIVVEGEAQIGNLGFAAVKFKGGDLQDPKAIKGLRFSDSQTGPEVNGPVFTIRDADKISHDHTVHDLKVLYRTAAGNHLSTKLMFKVSVKVDLDQIKNLRALPPEDKKQATTDFEITLKDNQQYGLTLLKDVNPDDGKPAVLVGLIGKVPSGWKLFPAHTIQEMYPGPAREPAKTETDKK